MAISNQEISNLTSSILKADTKISNGRVTYLRALIEATQEALGGQRNADTQIQLAALREVHERFYAVVLRVAGEFVPKGTRDRPIELHRRANFARTALSSVRRYARAGKDIGAIAAAKASKASLDVQGKPRPQTPKRLKARAESRSKAFIAALMELADADKASAVEELQLAMGQMTTQMMALGLVVTKDAAQAVAEHRPLRIGKTTFMPTETQVIRGMARPS